PPSAFPPKDVQRAPRSTGRSARRAVSEPPEATVTSRGRRTPRPAPPSGSSLEDAPHRAGLLRYVANNTCKGKSRVRDVVNWWAGKRDALTRKRTRLCRSGPIPRLPRRRGALRMRAADSFDHLVGEREQLVGNGWAERLGS